MTCQAAELEKLLTFRLASAQMGICFWMIHSYNSAGGCLREHASGSQPMEQAV